MLKTLFGAKIKIITGYPGGAEMSIAMERARSTAAAVVMERRESSKPEWITGKRSMPGAA